MSSTNLTVVPIRFNAKELSKVKPFLDPESKISPQLKRLILKAVESEAVPDIPARGSTELKLEGVVREKFDQMISLLKMVVERLDEQDAAIDKVAQDASRAMKVSENVQNYIADFLNALPAEN